MLAGCSSSSTLLSPRHNRLRSESPSNYHHHFQPMSTQRLDLPCGFARKDAPRSQPLRPVGISLDHQQRPIESRSNSIRLPPSGRENRDDFWERTKSLKRFAEHREDEDICLKRKRRNATGSEDFQEEEEEEDKKQMMISGSFWMQQPPFGPSSHPQVHPFSLSCSGEEDESVCFVAGTGAAPWVESVVTQVTDLGDKKVDPGSHHQGREASGSSASSDSHGLVLRRPESNPENPSSGNGSRRAIAGIPEVVVANPGSNEEEIQVENEGFELVSLLVACAEAISSKNVPGVNHFISRLGELASPSGGSPLARLSAYFTEAFALRISRVWPQVFTIQPPRDLDRVDDDGGGTSLRLLNQVSPIPRFIHFTSNEMILRAFEGKDRVHIIDFDVKQGLQWPSLFQSLASRTNPPCSHVRVTGIGESKQDLIETGDRLAGFAEALNLPFEFHPVVDRLEDVRLWMLHVKEKESVAVNCISQLHKLLYDGNPGQVLRDFLGLIRSVNPTIVLVAEQETDHNEPVFETRLCNALRYYSAIFDSLDASSGANGSSVIRRRIEEMFGREIRSIIACEGVERLDRHQGFAKWRRMMEEGGFRCIRTGERELLQSQMLLKMYDYENFKVQKQDEEGSGLTLSWLDQSLYTISGWTPVDAAGGSSSFSRGI